MDEAGKKKAKNRDVALLGRIFYIMQDIRSLQRRSEFQEGQLYHATAKLTGMPGGGGLPKGFDGILGELEEINAKYGKELEAYTRDLKAAEKILNGIGERDMKTFVRMVYVDRVPKTEVCRELEISEYQFEKARESIENAECMADAIWEGRA